MYLVLVILVVFVGVLCINKKNVGFGDSMRFRMQ